MSSATESAPVARPAASRLWRPPYVGIITVVLMFLGVGVGHAVMSGIEEALGHDLTYPASIGIGFAGIVLLWYGIKSKSESFATWSGFFAGIIVWMAWVEFFYMYYGRKNFGMMPRIMANGKVGSEPEYLIMAATVGVLLTMLCFYTFDKDTRCNMFVWIQNRLGLREALGPSTKTARDRNYAIITFMETFYVTWFVYAWNLLIFDPSLVGYGRSAFMAEAATVLVSIAWGGFCASRLIHYRRTSTALRYAIPTANILWINAEIFSHWGLFTEVWVEPSKYLLEVGLITVAFLVLTLLIVLAPKKPSETGEWRADEGAAS
jgi:hypothetical protein